MQLEPQDLISEDTVLLARKLIGKFICREINGQTEKYLITEVEAYHGFEDKASHARFGLTSRNKVMFERAGIMYVYLCYGIHWLLNIVTGPENFPAGILIRGIDNIIGPGLVSRILQINGSFNGKALIPESGIWLEDLNYIPNTILELPRVGINYAMEYKDLPWRFKLKD